jgi:hypothetical protein
MSDHVLLTFPRIKDSPAALASLYSIWAVVSGRPSRLVSAGRRSLRIATSVAGSVGKLGS